MSDLEAEVIAPQPKRISDFLAEHWDHLPDDVVRVHFIALCKALHRRFGTTETLTQLRAVSLYVEQVLAPAALREIAREINAQTIAQARATDAPGG